MGVGRATQQPSLLETAVDDLTAITGQKPIVTKAKHSIAGFKLREGQAIGTKVTLRGDRMWEFFDRLDCRRDPPHPRLPRSAGELVGRPWQLHVRSQRPDRVHRDRVDKIDIQRGMDITIVTTATTDEAGTALLDAFGFPFKKGADDSRGALANAHRVAQSVAAGPPRRDDRVGNIEMAKKALINKANRQAEVQGSGLHAVPPLRPPARRVPEVRSLPCLPARARPCRRDPRSDEVELVREETC